MARASVSEGGVQEKSSHLPATPRRGRTPRVEQLRPNRGEKNKTKRRNGETAVKGGGRREVGEVSGGETESTDEQRERERERGDGECGEQNTERAERNKLKLIWCSAF